MQTYKTIREYDLDRTQLKGCKSCWDFIWAAINLVAKERNWGKLQHTMYEPLGLSKLFNPSEGEYVFIGLFENADPFYECEGFLIHMDYLPEQDVHKIYAFVFPELKVKGGGKYFEHSHTSFSLKDNHVIYMCTDVYADCADIKDHAPSEIYTQAMYDIQEHIFYFPEEFKG